MAITDIVANAKQIREKADAVQVRQQEEKQAIEQAETEKATTEFKLCLNQYAESVLALLDEQPKFYYSQCYGASCRFVVYHRIVVLRIDGAALTYNRPEWVIGNDYNNSGIFQGHSSEQSGTYKVECVRGKDLAARLALLVLDIAEDHTQLLPKIESAKLKAAKKAELDRQYEEYDALLANAIQKSVEQMDELITELQTFSWSSPKDFAIALYKIRWCAGASYRDSEYEDASVDFEYESGWALSDVPDSSGYFTLLPKRGEKARKVQPVHLAEIECIQISDLGDIPAVLIENLKHEVEVVEVKVTGDYFCTSKHIVLPHHLPVAPEGVTVSTTTTTRTLELGVQPIIEIRRAIDLAATESTEWTSRFSEKDLF